MPEILEAVPNDPDAQANFDQLNEGDRGLVVELAKYFDRRVANTLRAKMRAEKRDYDAQGETKKTPFALRNITDPHERAFIMANTVGFATTHGCTGGCDWCCYDAFTTGDLEVTPLDQKKHFLDEYADAFAAVHANPDTAKEAARCAVQRLALYVATDPFDDPDVLQITQYSNEKFGATPALSTVIPNRGEEAFKYLTAAARKHHDAEMLETFIKNGDKWARQQMAKFKIPSLDAMEKIELRLIHLGSLKSFYGEDGMLFKLLPMIDEKQRAMTYSGHEEMFQFYGFGDIGNLPAEELSSLKERAKQKIEEDEKALDPYKNLLKSNRSLASLLKKEYETVLERCGMGPIDSYFGSGSEEEVAAIPKKIAAYKKQLQDERVPNPGQMRVSITKRREKLVRELLASGKHYFKTEGRDGALYDLNSENNSGFFISGRNFFNSGKEHPARYNKQGISCQNGMFLTPFVLTNSVAGEITHNHPQGRIVVPYQGLRDDSELSTSNTPLGEILPHVIVINDTDFGGIMNPPDKILVLDGKKRLRNIKFDHTTYCVIKDEIVKENVESLADINGVNYKMKNIA